MPEGPPSPIDDNYGVRLNGKREGESELPGLEVRLLGSFTVSIDGEVVAADAWRLGKAKDVIKLLALASRYRLHRDQLIDILWPDHDPKSGANNLYQALSAARRAITSAGGDGPACLRLEDEWVTLCPTNALWIDVDVFDEMSGSDDPADLHQALSLHRGELLADDRYVEWVASRREAVRQRYRAVLVALGRHYEQVGDLREAQAFFDRLVDDDPVNESAHQALMRVHAASGDRGAAIRQYETLELALRSELEVEPSLQSRDLLDDIRSGRFGPVSAESPNNLPVAFSTFVGREREMIDLPPLVGRSRLVTLTGSGGCGKTRLAIEVAGRCLDEFDDGVFLIELGPLANVSRVDLEIGRALGVRAAEGERLVAAIARRIGSERMLLVLDNCEHLINAVAATTEALLTECPQLVVLATSREPLRLPGEVVQRVPSLDLPDPSQALAPDELARYGAVRLLVDRISVVDPTFAVSESNSDAVATVCFRLDGLPLALELAAGRVPALTITEVAARLDDRFHLLAGGRRTALTRHQTLEGTVEWSFDLLTEAQQTLFSGLSVFRGTFDVEAAEAVARVHDGMARDVASQLADLVDRSMVVAEARGEHARFRLLETMREYGTARLRAQNRLNEVRSCHARWFAEFVDDAADEFAGPDRHRWLARLEASREDVRAAFTHLLATDSAKALRMASLLWPYWLWFGYLDDGLSQLEEALASDTGPSEERSECWLGAFAIHTRWSGIGKPGMQTYVENATAEAREVGSPRAESKALVFDGIYWYVMDVNALDLADERFRRAQEIARASALHSEEATALHARAVVAWYRQDLTLSRQLLLHALDLVRTRSSEKGSLLMFTVGPVVSSMRLGEQWLVWEETLMPYRATAGRCAEAYVLASLGSLERAAGRMSDARRHLEEALAIYSDEGDLAGEAMTRARLGRLALAQGDFDDARAGLERAVAIHERSGDSRSLQLVRLSLARVAIESGSYDAARHLISDTERIVRERGDLPALSGTLAVRGVLEIAEGDPLSAVATLTEGLEVQESIGHHLTLAVAALDLADAYMKAGHQASAAAPAEEGLAVFEALGYRDAADRCRHILAGD